MQTRTVSVIAVVAFALLLSACAGSPPANTPEARLEQARAVARIEIAGGALDQTLDLGAAFARERSAAELASGIGRALTEEEGDRVEGVMRASLGEVLTEERFEAAVAEVYASHFTAAELAEIAEFFETPTGKKVLGVMASVTGEIGRATEAILEENLDTFVASVDDRLAAEFPELAGEAQP